MKKQAKIYSGKAKSLYLTDDSDLMLMEFRDDITAFNAEKSDSLAGKGNINNQFNAFIMQKLHEADIPTHFVKTVSDNESLVKRLQMIPVECVVRNVAAGSICKRLNIQEGRDLQPAIFEFFYKDDALGDPMINEYHVVTFGWATEREIEQMKEYSFRINQVLKKLFLEANILLVDYKLEFGRYHGEIILGDEFTPDGCRIWDITTQKKFDKDRFRRDLGNVIEAYREAAERLGVGR